MPHTNLAKLLGERYIDEIALPSNIRYGKAIQRRGGVEFITRDLSHAEAWVGGLDGSATEGGGQRRRIKLWLEDEKIVWHCAGNPKDHQIFCKHCVALALEILKNEE